MDELDKAGRQKDTPAGSHPSPEDGRPPMAPTRRAQAQRWGNSAVGLRLDTLGTLSILSGGSGETSGFSGEQRRDVPESGRLVPGHGDHDQIFDSEEDIGDFGHEIPQEAVRTVCEQAARNIQAMLRRELRGGLHATLREEVGRAVREEFQSCSQELRELRPQRISVESGCQTDATTVSSQLRTCRTKSDDDLSWPTGASFPQHKTSTWAGQLVTPDPWSRTVATISCGKKPRLLGPGDEASQLIVPRHGVDSDSFTSAVPQSGQFMVDKEKSAEVPWQHRLVKYAAAPKRSISSPEDRKGPTPRQGSSSGTRRSLSPPRASRRACQTGADPAGGADAKHPACLSKQDFSELASREQALAGEFLCEGDVLFPRDDAKGRASSSWEQQPQDRAPLGAQRAWASAGEEGEAYACSSGESARREVCVSTSRSAAEEVSVSASGTAAEEAVRAYAGSEAASAPELGCWNKLGAGFRVPTVEALRMQMDQELIRQFTLDNSDEELESVASAPPRAKLGRCSRLAALPAKICRFLGSMVAPVCGLVPWDSAYPLASTLYQWILFGFVGASLYHTVSRSHTEWELDESSCALILMLDAIMGTGAILCMASCGALRRSRALVQGCRLVMVYASKLGMLVHWEEVSITDLVCTVSLWCAAVLAAVAEALYCEQSATAEELISHVVCFALFAFILMGMSQFTLHICRCITKMIDTFCYQLSQQPDFPKALKEWSLLQALCRSACTSIQFAFISLQVTAVAVVLLSIQEVGRHENPHAMALVPALIVAVGVFRTALWAAAVTDKCVRVPMLVNSVQVEAFLDQDRMYAVHYIAYSQAGFYVFDFRLTTSAVLKTAYVACAVTFFLVTRVFVV